MRADFHTIYRKPRISWTNILQEIRYLQTGDGYFFFTIFFLVIGGMIMLYSASAYIAYDANKPESIHLIKQLRNFFIAVLAFASAAYFKVEVWRKFVKLGILITSIMMLLQLYTPLGIEKNGAHRWFNFFGQNIQTSDFARTMLIVYLAKVFGDDYDLVLRPNLKILKILLVPAVLILLVFLQPDLTSALLIGLITLFIMMLAGISLKVIFAICLVGASLAALSISIHKYQLNRVVTHVFGWFGLAEIPFHQVQSLIGFVRGGIFGVGPGQSGQKMLFLPEPHTDFIFSVIAEEFGLIGTILVLGVFIVLLIKGAKIVLKQTDRYRFLLGSALLTMLIIFATVNMLVSTGMLPTTGLPLPFISKGGSNLIVSLWSCGIIYRLSCDDNVYRY